MKKLLAAAAVVSMLAVAAPASAQSWQEAQYQRDRDDRYDRDRDWDRDGRYDRDDRDRYDRDRYDDRHRYDRDINWHQRRLEQRIWAGMRSGRLSEREAGRLRAEFGHIVRLERRYSYNGLSRWERADLSRRLDRLDTLLTAELRDRNDYRG